MAFWGVEVKPGKPYTYSSSNNSKGRLHVSQATLAIVPSTPPEGIVFLQCNIGSKSPLYLCALSTKTSVSFSLNVEFNEEEDVIFSVLGPCSVHLVGYFLNPRRDDNETESFGEDLGIESDKEKSAEEGEDSYEDSFIDDDEPQIFHSEESEDRQSNCKKRKRNHSKKYRVVISEDESEERISAPKKKKKKKTSTLKDDTSSSLRNTPSPKDDGSNNGVRETDDSKLKPTIEAHPSGLKVETLKSETEGKVAVAGKKVKLKYSAKIKESGEVFEFSDDAFPKKFRLGKGAVVKGLEMGIEGMRVGEKRRITVPPSLGYGKDGNADFVPPNSWLIYDVELLRVR